MNLKEGFSLVFSEGLASYSRQNPFENLNADSRVHGFINKKGDIVIQPKYEFKIIRGSSVFQEGLALVSLDKKLGYIDPKGKVVISFQYEDAQPFHDSLAAVQDNKGQWGFIDKIGRYVIKPQFEEATFFNEGLAPVRVTRNNEDKWGFIDKTGKFIIQAKYNNVDSFNEGWHGQFR